MKSRLANLNVICFVFASFLRFGKEWCPRFLCTFPIFTSGAVCITDILLNSVVPSVGGFVWSPCGGWPVLVLYQSYKNGCDAHREENASTIIKAYNNTSVLPYILHYVVRAVVLPAFRWEREIKTMVCTYWSTAAVVAIFISLCVVSLRQHRFVVAFLLRLRSFDVCYAYVGPGDGELVAPES